MCRYYNDVWAFDTEELSWQELARPDTVPPPPRGGSQVAVYGNSLYVYGGHRYNVAEDGSESEVVMDDMWQLDLKSLQVCQTGYTLFMCKQSPELS